MMSKPLPSLILALFSGLFIFSSCKKGEDDPFISFHSRTARLEGEWKVTKMEYSESSVSGEYSTSRNINYDGTTEVSTITTKSPMVNYSETESKVYTETYLFRKGGTFTYHYYSAPESKQVDGTWTFLAKNETEKLKNKEAIFLNRDQNVSMNGSVGFKDYVIRINQLKSKEMVWKFSTSSSENGNSYSSEQTITLTKQ